jgi:hypothetical protein
MSHPSGRRPPSPLTRLFRRLRSQLRHLPVPRALARHERIVWLRRVNAPEPDRVLALWERKAPAPGESAPEFSLRTPAGATVRLAEVLQAKPVVLIFGSYT